MDKEKIEIVDVVSLKNKDSPYVKPFRVHFKRNDGKTLKWDCIKTHDSVAILIYNKTRNVLVFVRQFRPPVFLSTLFNTLDSTLENIKQKSKELKSDNCGYTLELCAGIIDKDGLTPQQIAREEVLEETGYNPPLDSLELITAVRTGVGTSGSLLHLYYCPVEDSMRVNSGGGVDDESIEVIELSINESKKQIYAQDLPTSIGRTPSLRLAISWFIHEKLPEIYSK